jgi:hypothetical protein
MHLPDLNPPPIVSMVGSPAPVLASASAISADIRAIQTWRERELELAMIREFGDDWDGRGSDAPTASALDAAALFLAIYKKDHLENPPARLALSSSGFLNVDWLDGDALVRAEILDLNSNEIEWMKAIPGHPTQFFTTVLTGQTGSRTEQVQTWQPAPAAEDELALAYAR